MSTDAADDGVEFKTGIDAVADVFYPLYDWLFDEDGDFAASIETKLAEARMAETVELYLTRSVAVGAVTGLVLWILGSFIGFVLFATGIINTEVLLGVPLPSESMVRLINAVKVPALILITGIVFGLIGFSLGFGAVVAIPYAIASERDRKINMLLPDAISFMYALSVGGLNQLEILEAMAKADDTYGPISQEFQSIIQETNYFDTDYRTAIQKQARETPSDELSQFFTDMLSIINSGGDMTSFLNDKKQKHMRTAKQQQEMTLETLELFGEMYMTLSMFPLLLIIILVIMTMMGQSQDMLLYGTVYGLIPIVGVAFLILLSTVKEDEIGDGHLNPSETDEVVQASNDGVFSLGIVSHFTGTYQVFNQIRNREGIEMVKDALRHPHLFFRDNPLLVLVLTVPLSLVVVGTAVAMGAVPMTLDAMKENAVWGTFVLVYVPMYLNLFPLAFFREWNIRSRRAVINNLSDNLRKLASANDTGLTLLEAMQSLSETSTGKLADEFEVIHAKVEYGMNMKQALVEFNNKYHIPRLSRTMKLITKAQEASSEISDVLTTAAQASENQDDIDRERISRTRMQVAIIIMTYVTLLGVMVILKVQFIDMLAGLGDKTGGGGGGAGGASTGLTGNVEPKKLSMMFFHAVTMQAIMSGFIAGYIRDADLLSGAKFTVVLSTIALVAFSLI